MRASQRVWRGRCTWPPQPQSGVTGSPAAPELWQIKKNIHKAIRNDVAYPVVGGEGVLGMGQEYPTTILQTTHIHKPKQSAI